MYDMHYGYVEGYRNAAEVLFNHIKDTGGEIDTLIYPIMFMIRQHFELRLKNILNLLHALGERQNVAPFKHNLDLLWNEAKGALGKFTPTEDQQWFSSISVLMKQLTDEDAGADAFRFTHLKNGSKSLVGISHINLQHLFLVVTPVMDWLEGAESFLDDLKSNLGN
jgi:hypothetical protein